VRYADITFRPIEAWPGELTRGRRRAQFSARWGQTIQLLESELTHLNARQAVFQVTLEERDFRIDGTPRARAQSHHPGVILAFNSKFGPLKYAVDTFDNWQDNVRAIALAMEALRKVDRYGVTKRGEQYTGWKALPVSTDAADAVATREQAEALLAGYGGITAALKATHPDHGGDPDEFRRVMRAKALTA